MKITLADGSVLEVNDPDEIEQVTGLLGLRPKPKPKTQAEELREAIDAVKINGIASIGGPSVVVARALDPQELGPTKAYAEEQAGIKAPRNHKLFLPVTKWEKDAITIMRTAPLVEWTSTSVADEVSATGDYRHQLKAAVSKACRGGRGILRGRDNQHYYLDEFGREAELVIFQRPSSQWASMQRAAEAGRNWTPSAAVRKLIGGS